MIETTDFSIKLPKIVGKPFDRKCKKSGAGEEIFCYSTFFVIEIRFLCVNEYYCINLWNFGTLLHLLEMKNRGFTLYLLQMLPKLKFKPNSE